jgi:hypothetical protein
MTTKKTIKVPLVLPPSNCALTRDMTKKGRKPKSQTPGTQKVATLYQGSGIQVEGLQ